MYVRTRWRISEEPWTTRLAGWFGDLWHTASWWAEYGVWSPPTRRWQGRYGRSRWPMWDTRSMYELRQTFRP